MIHPWLNHLWQSTLFAIVAGFMTLAFLRNGAHIRYWLWFVASCKFLLPFSLLSALGSHFHWARSSAHYAPMAPMLERVAQPFSTAPTALPIASTVTAPGPGIDPEMIMMGVWVCGALAVGIYWLARWLKIQATVRHATPMLLDEAIPVKSSPSNSEPGVIGIFRPVLLLPEGICERLSPGEMQTILTHEMCHVSRRDNLTAAIHMLVEALFWFHPLVWWTGRRLIVEREAACDEAVIAAGGDPETYASGLLQVCKFYLESRLECAAGVAGADLEKRIERIMTPRLTHGLSAARKVLLATVATAAILTPIVMGSLLGTASRVQADMTDLDGASFQSVTIRASQPGDLNKSIVQSPGVFRTENYSLRDLMAFAFDVQNDEISGPPILDSRYDVDAKAPGAFMITGYGTVDSGRAMVRKMLADRFQLEFHRATQSLSAYVLTASAAGTHVREAPDGEQGPLIFEGVTSVGGQAVRMAYFCELLSPRMGHAVIDQTGLTKAYDINLDWKTASSQASKSEEVPAVALPNPSPEVIINALQTQLGITARLEQRPVEVLVVDRVQPPKDLLAVRKAVPMDPHLFDAYVGHYEFSPDSMMTVSRESGSFWTQLPGQPKVEIFPEGPRDFFAKVVDAQITFASDSQGRVTELVLHQGGQDIHAPRVDEAVAKQRIDAIAARIRNNVPAPGSEQALRRYIEEVVTGKPNYDRMSPDMAEATRQQLPGMQKRFTELGVLGPIKFTGVDTSGWDIYRADFAHGSSEWHIEMASDGNINNAWYNSAP